jgi:tRNA (guanine-N7-)-methyltransferase
MPEQLPMAILVASPILMGAFPGNKLIWHQPFKSSLARKLEKRVYGRRTGRPLSATRQKALEDVLPKLEIDSSLLSENSDVHPRDLFNKAPDFLNFEIGFGSGEHLLALMEKSPDEYYLGAEPFINGMSHFLKNFSPQKIPANLKVLMDDALLLAKSLKENSVDRIYILNPDPWHKKRHHKRRIINQNNLDIFARILKPQGNIIVTTDVPDLADWIIINFQNHGHFCWHANNCNDWQKAPPDWIQTRYETKGAKGARKMSYLEFKNK